MKVIFLIVGLVFSVHSFAERGPADLSLVLDAKLCQSSFRKLGMTTGPSPVTRYGLKSAELNGTIAVKGTGPLGALIESFVPDGVIPLMGTVKPGTNGLESIYVELNDGTKPGEVTTTFQYKMDKNANAVSEQVKEEEKLVVTGRFKKGKWTDVVTDKPVEIEIPVSELLKSLKASIPPPAAADPNKIFHIKGTVKIERFSIDNLSTNGKKLIGGDMDVRATVHITLPQELKDLIRDEGPEAILQALPNSQFHWDVKTP